MQVTAPGTKKKDAEKIGYRRRRRGDRCIGRRREGKRLSVLASAAGQERAMSFDAR